MAGVLTEPARTTVTVDKQATAKLLDEAVRQRASIHVRPGGENAVLAFSGTVTGSEGYDLTLEFSRLNAKGIGKLRETKLEAVIEVDQLRYAFESQCTNEPGPAETTTLRVRRPETMTLTDRRRSPRRRLRGRTEVSLSGLDVDFEWLGQALMLNLSAEGMACRLAVRDAARLEVGQVLGVTFGLGASITPFNLNARVSNVTEGGTPGEVVVGLAFMADERLESNQTRLRQALRNAE